MHLTNLDCVHEKMTNCINLLIDSGIKKVFSVLKINIDSAQIILEIG